MFKKIFAVQLDLLITNNVFKTAKRKYSLPGYTKDNYFVKRGNYGTLKGHHVLFFKELLGENRVLSNSNDLLKYNVDWRSQVQGCSTMVLKPKNTEEVSKILKFCNENKLAVCVQGGNTGVVGGATPVFDEVILSTELLNNVISVNETSGVLVCEAGCILQNLNEHMEDNGLMVPLDLGAKGSCQIGGNVSTNAGGLRLLRYGNMHGNILGLEVVTAKGEILDLLSTLKKDNTGYHLKHLFIGSEGTLGVVTKVAIQCIPKPKHVSVIFLGLQSYEKVLETFKKAKEDLGEILSAVEVLDTPTMDFINTRLEKKSPIGNFPFYLLLETSGSHQKHDEEKLNKFLESSLESQLILNGTVASNESKVKEIWSLRETIPNGFKKEGDLFLYDVTLPLENYYTLVDDMRKYMGNLATRVWGFGHLGDGNLHLQLSINKFSKEVKSYVEPYVFERTMELNGSISAEHGMGFLKGRFLPLARPKGFVDLMGDLKKMLDPNGILNPYKVFPYESPNY